MGCCTVPAVLECDELHCSGFSGSVNGVAMVQMRSICVGVTGCLRSSACHVGVAVQRASDVKFVLYCFVLLYLHGDVACCSGWCSA